MNDLDLLKVFDSTAGRRLDDIRSILTVVIANVQPHDRQMVERVAANIFDAALEILLPDSGDAPRSRRDTTAT